MAKKKTRIEKPRHEPTRRQRSRWKQQKRRQRIILGLAILVVVAVLGTVGFGLYNGWYVPEYKPLHETVIEVNGAEFDMQYCIDTINFQLGDYYYYAEYYFDSAIESIEKYELVRQEAEKLGFTVSEDEVTAAIELNEYDDTPAVRDAVRASLLLNKLGDDYFDQQVPTSAAQRYIRAMFLESEEQTNEISARLAAGEDFGTLAAEFSLEDVTKEAGGELGWLSEDVLPLVLDNTVLEENAFSCEVGVLSQPLYEADSSKDVGYWLIEVDSVDDTADPVVAEVKAMLLGSEQEANEIRARLEAGEDFATLAAEFSQDADSSADGGEFEASQGDGTTAFDGYVFGADVELGVLSQPIRDEEVVTPGGYWLIMAVVSVDDRPLSEDNRDLLKNEIMNAWIDGLFADPNNEIVSYLTDDMKSWAVSYITAGGG